jgi:hypothetical protein
MTLVVVVYTVDPSTGALRDAPAAALSSDLAGVESWRTTVWSSEPIRRRGAVFLPRLAHEDLLIHARDLVGFRAECMSLLSQAREISHELWGDDNGDAIAFRLRNIIAAAEKADPLCGAVYIG